MLNDNDLIPLCHRWARKFLPQAKHLGGRKEAFDDLTNLAYVTAKEMKTIDAASTMIMWALIRYTKICTVELDEHENDYTKTNRRDDPANISLIDKRTLTRPNCPSACELVCIKEERLNLLKAIANLDDLYKTVVVMYYAKDMTFEQIGKAYDRNPVWAHRTINRAIEAIRTSLNKKGDKAT